MTSVSTTTSATTSAAAATSSATSASSSNSTSSADYLSFDTQALVEAKLSSRLARIDSLSTKVSGNDTKIAAYQDMQELLQTVVGKLDALRSAPGTSGQDSDVFRERTGYLTSSTATAASTYLSATVDPGTDLGTHTIEIGQVAQSNILKTAAQSSKSTDLGWSGVIKLGTTGGGSADITITATMSLADIADAINAGKSASGVSASVMKVSDSAYVLVLSSTATGQTITASDSTGTLLGDSGKLGMLDGGGAINAANVLQAAQNAELTVDGVAVSRSSNDIGDLLEGVTLHLYAAPATDTTLTLEVDNNLSDVKIAISDFVDAYNAFRDFVITNQQTNSDGSAASGATLFGDFNLRSISQQVQSILSSSVDQTGLANLGITFDSDNRLVVNSTTLENVLLNDFSAVQALFSYRMTASSGDLGLVAHPSSSLSFTLDIAVDASGALSGASVGGDSSMFTVSGATIKGVDGTAYEGLTLVYTGTTAKSIAVELSQGIADQMYRRIDAVSNADNGTLEDVISSLESANTTLSDRMDSLQSAANTYSDYLYSLYGAIASKLSTAQTTLDLLKALLNASSSN